MARGMLKFYKSIGALQVELIPARFNDKEYLEKEGAILFTIAPGNKDKNNPEWDWSRKIVFALGVPDIATLLSPDGGKCFHQTEKGTKKLEIAPGQSSGWSISLSSNGADGKKDNAMVYLTDDELTILRKVVADLLTRVCGFVV
jgi:hypothetical protein